MVKKSAIVQSVRDLGVQFRSNDVNITGQDGATSTLLPDGRSLWIFGDTIEGPFETIRYHPLDDVLSNTGSLIPQQNISDGIKQFDYLKTADNLRPRQLLKFLPHEDKSLHRVWAVHGVCVQDSIYLYYHKITMDPVLDVFEAITLDGMGIARSNLETFEFKRLVAPDGTYEFWKGDVPGWGVFNQEVEGYIYLWGSLSKRMHLARVRPNEIETLDAYEYLVEAPTNTRPETIPVWDSQFSPTAPLFKNVPNEMSCSYNAYLGQYIALTTFEREDKLVIRAAPAPSGPWSEPEVFHRPPKAAPDSLFNAGKEHPEFSRENGRITYMTYIDSNVYMPHLIEITLA